MSWNKAQRRVADRSAQRSINAMVAERAAHYYELFFQTEKKRRTPQTWSPTPLNANMEAMNLPVTPPPIPFIATIYPVPVSSTSQTTGDDMQALNDNTDKRPVIQDSQPLNKTSKQTDTHIPIEDVVAAKVIAYQQSHEKHNPPSITIHPMAQTILEIRGYARDGYILKTTYGDRSTIKICLDRTLHVDQVVCGEVKECNAS